MRIFVTGGTGSIGGAIVPALIRRGHEVLALGRSAKSRHALEAMGALPVPGSLQQPDRWTGVVADVDAVIHTAATWGDDMADAERHVVSALLTELQRDSSGKAFVYTGGCWLYGATGDTVATEESPFDGLPEFAWSIPLVQEVLAASAVRGMVVHPAMVYERDGGVFSHIFDDARTLGYVRIVGDEQVRWPLVHREDLAELYALLIENGKPGDVYNGAAEEGVPIGRMTRAIARRLGIDTEPVVYEVEAAFADFGSSAAGYALDQRMSGRKAMRELSWDPRYKDVFAVVS